MFQQPVTFIHLNAKMQAAMAISNPKISTLGRSANATCFSQLRKSHLCGFVLNLNHSRKRSQSFGINCCCF